MWRWGSYAGQQNSKAYNLQKLLKTSWKMFLNCEVLFYKNKKDNFSFLGKKKQFK